ncbi:MAG TPA: hypothetical protein VIT92_01375 [Burkholderiaceae bacterium]
MADPRGFEYTLAPLALKCGWDMDEAGAELARAKAAVAAQQAQVAALAQDVQHARICAQSTVRLGALLDLDAQRRAFRYLERSERKHMLGMTSLRDLETVCDAVLLRLASLHQYAEGLDGHRSDAIKQYVSERAQTGFKEADDTWLQRLNWRENA